MSLIYYKKRTYSVSVCLRKQNIRIPDSAHVLWVRRVMGASDGCTAGGCKVLVKEEEEQKEEEEEEKENVVVE